MIPTPESKDKFDTSPATVYEDLKSKYDEKLSLLTKWATQVSMLRIFIFMSGIVTIYFAARISMEIVVVVALAFFIVFVIAVIWHNRLHKRKEEMERLVRINLEELKALNGDFSSFDGASGFSDPNHPFAGDLDVFGQGSIFQYINRTSTVIGQSMLANWLIKPETKAEILKNRQEAVQDLAPRVGWRQMFRSSGMSISESKGDKEGILLWINRKTDFQKTHFRVLLWTIPFISATMLLLLILGTIPFQVFTLYIIVPLAISYSQFSKIGKEHEMLSRKSELLKKYSRLMDLIENEDFKSKRMLVLLNLLETQLKSGFALKRLSKIVNALDSRLNIFGWIILNYLMLWDILQAVRLEKWRNTYRDKVPGWFEILSEVDALCSLANLRFNRPGFVFPTPVEEDFQLYAENCGHPLMNEKVRVDNPVDFGAWGQFIIVTGANMAGKSTYLRAVAVNYLLAMIGAPVCATKFQFSPAGIFTSIRTRDDLLQNESYFFAELKRLKAIITSLEEGQKLFIILDEILKGTNSKDKQTGSKALLKQLVRYGASGLIATHDLSLGDLILEYPENIRNKRFEVEIRNDELVFDYKLKEGISQNLNATFLMKKMGITV